MTSVLFDYRQHILSGLASSGGTITLRPSRRVIANELDGSPVILPEPLPPVTLVDGQATVSLRPSGTDWCWVLTEPDGNTRHIAVPDSVSTLDASELVDVDPDTLDPAVSPSAAWAIALDAALARIDTLEAGGGSGVSDASTTAKGIVELATSAETIAGSDTSRAVTPAGLAAALGTVGALSGLGVAIWSSSTGWPSRPTCTICFWIGTQSASAGYPAEATDYDVTFQHPDAP